MKATSKPIVHLLICVSVLIIATLACNFTSRTSSALAVALRFDGDPTLTVYTGNPQDHLFWLPAGEYYIEAMDSEGLVYEGWREVVKPVADGGDSISISKHVRGNGQTNEEIASQLQTLADFIISVELAQLTYLEVATAGFQETFQASVGDIKMSDADPFYARLQEIADQEESVFAAIDALESRAKLAFADTPQNLNGALASKISLCPRLGLWDSLVSFFSFTGEEDKLAQQEILSVSAAMTPGEKEEAFYWLSTERIGNAQNYDEFLALLQAGELKNITSIRSDLYNGGPYQGVYQTINPDSNRPGGETIHRAGAELVTRGATLHVEVVKEVLTTVFPGIDKGFEYADKISEWAEFVRNMYIDPLGTLQDMTIDMIKSEIMENIQWDLMSAIPDLDEQAAEQLAGSLTNEIMTSHTALITIIAEAQAVQQQSNTQQVVQEGSNSDQNSETGENEVQDDNQAGLFSVDDCSCGGFGVPLNSSSASNNNYKMSILSGDQVDVTGHLTCDWQSVHQSENITGTIRIYLNVYNMDNAQSAQTLFTALHNDIASRPHYCEEDDSCTVAIADFGEDRAFYAWKNIYIGGKGQLPSDHGAIMTRLITTSGKYSVLELSVTHPELEMGDTWVIDIAQAVEACVMGFANR